VVDAELNAMREVATTLTVASNAEGAPHTASLAGTGHKSLVSHYYRTILGRAPDAGGLDFWQRETARLAALGADVNEAWFAMARAFFASAEYQATARDDAEFVSSLYRVFFNREADGDGLAYWTSELRQGLPRDIVLLSFMLSPEFRAFSESVFGPQHARTETLAVMDYYRGLLNRLPDDAGYRYWVQRFQAAQCVGAEAIRSEADAITQAFFQGSEYAARERSDTQYVTDLYDAMLRRGGDRQGVAYWIGQLESGARTRDEVRRAFLAAPEFNARLDAIAQEGCSR